MLEKEAMRNWDADFAYAEHTKIYEQYDGLKGTPLPLEFHQAVLRTCTPSHNNVRAYTARLLQEDKVRWHKLNHPCETRFRKILENIIDAGFKPSIEDYHFILSHFAAVGHYKGARKYMRRMGEMGLEPNRETFGFFLEAIAHRISLPTPSPSRSIITRGLITMTFQTLREMADRRMPPSAKNLDLAFRILNQVHDLEGLTKFLKLSYGMDLSYLDSPPIDAASVPSTSTTDSSLEVQPFSTSALNSLLETLGRWSQISKMVYVFETLTNPLPVPSKPDNTFDDDDDDFSPVQQKWKRHSAKPNTTSFNTLIKYCVAFGYPALAKHYAVQLMHQEHMSTIRLREDLKQKPLSEIEAPHLAVNFGTLRPIEGFANRSHNVELLRWVIRACKLSVRRKYRSWTYYDLTKSKYDPQLEPSTSDAPVTPESSSSFAAPPIPPSLSTPSRSPTFHIPTHLWVLKHDIASLFDLRWVTRNRLSSTITKNKARLGRRVRRGKNVWMRDKGERVEVSLRAWKKKVNFRENKRKLEQKQKQKKYLGKNFDPAIADIGSSRASKA